MSAPVRASIRTIASGGGVVGRVNELPTMHFGPNDALVTLSLDFDDHIPAAEVERAITRIERAAHRDVRRAFIEAQGFEAHHRTLADLEARTGS